MELNIPALLFYIIFPLLKEILILDEILIKDLSVFHDKLHQIFEIIHLQNKLEIDQEIDHKFQQ